MVRSSRNQDVPTEQPARNFSPRGIAALIAPVVRPAFRKRAPAAAQLLADWESLAGPEFCRRAVPVKFAAGTLTLACSGPVAMELQYQAGSLISRLNLGVGQKMIERLRFIQQTTDTPQAVITPSRRGTVKPPENLPEGPLGEALAKLYQGLVRKG
ncbi:MAG: hypothetical protein B7Z75_05105 [Acidocella sp. 20-57-95]|nr:MAG: hypothetical protein B7Z75_05105 [Acidocella sp. 20-57-95]OYV58407.1 MAG: hypothetical protein B7Z71_10335 [Acidocella sp. 21-58-7]